MCNLIKCFAEVHSAQVHYKLQLPIHVVNFFLFFSDQGTDHKTCWRTVVKYDTNMNENTPLTLYWCTKMFEHK